MDAMSGTIYVGQFTFAHGKSFSYPALADTFQVFHVSRMHQLLQEPWYQCMPRDSCASLCRRFVRNIAKDLTSGFQRRMGEVSPIVLHGQDLVRAVFPTAFWLWSGFTSLHSTYWHLWAYSYKGRCGIKACRHMPSSACRYRQCLTKDGQQHVACCRQRIIGQR